MKEIELTQKQKEIFQEILSSPDDVFLVKGGFGSGKTTLGMYLVLFYLRTGRKVLISRLDVREIENTLLPVLFDLALPEERKFLQDSWNKNNQVMRHPNGGVLYYLSLEEKGGHYRKVRSYQFSFVLIDEASEISESAFHEVLMRVRENPPLKVVLLTNPVGENHWIYQFFKGKKVFTLRTSDNPFLPKQYLERLQKYPDEVKKVIMEGEWGEIDFEGIKFKISDEYLPFEFEKVDLIYMLENHTKVIISADWGYRRTAFALGVVDWDTRLHLIDEFEYSEKSINEIFEDLEEKLGTKYRLRLRDLRWVGDVAGRQRNYWGETLHSYLQKEYGISVWGEKIGLEESIKLIDLILSEKIEVQDDDLKKYERPYILIYPNCKRIKQALEKAYKIRDDYVEKDEDLEHIADAVRYLIYFYYKYYRKGKIDIWSFARRRYMQ